MTLGPLTTPYLGQVKRTKLIRANGSVEQSNSHFGGIADDVQ